MQESNTSPLIEHLESQFGTIVGSWCSDDTQYHSSIQIVEFRRGTVNRVTILRTLGLSHVPIGTNGTRQELFLMIKDGQLDAGLPAILDQVARERVRSEKAVPRGEVISKPGVLPGKGEFVALYAIHPVYYPDSFLTLRDKEGEILICWLLPIKHEELHYLQRNGWSKFDDLLDHANFDLFDLERPSVV